MCLCKSQQKSRNSKNRNDINNNNNKNNTPSLEAVRLALLSRLRRRRPAAAGSAAATATRPLPTLPRNRMLPTAARSRLEILTLPDLRTILMQLINEKTCDSKLFSRVSLSLHLSRSLSANAQWGKFENGNQTISFKF